MIFKRIVEQLRDQNWAAFAIEFAVGVGGLYTAA